MTRPETEVRAPRPTAVPPFEPHPWLRSGHLQTLVGSFLPGPRARPLSTYHELDAGDGDRLTALETVPAGWAPGDPLALLVHGLAGSVRSPYVVRVTGQLARLGVRVVRMNLRGAGAGFGLARGIYHAGRTDDLRLVSDWVTRRAQGSPLALVGFSLGGNLVLKLAAEAATSLLAGLDCVVAANPPIDLALCSRHIRGAGRRVYDRNFVRHLRGQVRRLHAAFPDLGPGELPRNLTLLDFDDRYTAPRNGFASAEDYYERSSAGPRLGQVAVPGLVIHATDDPFIPVEPFLNARFPSRLALELIPGGGHLGYVSHRAWLGSHRWLDNRIAVWLAGHWGLSPAPDRPAAGLPHRGASGVPGSQR